MIPLSPPKGGSKREFLHLALPFISSLQVIVDTSDLDVVTSCDHVVTSCDPFSIFSPPKMSVEWLKLETSNLVCMSQPMDDKLSLKGVWSLSRDLFNFWKISDNISKMVRDSLMVSIKFE